MVDPIDYSASAGRAMLQGLAAGRAIQGIRQASQEMDAANAAEERQKLFNTALQNTPPDQLHKLRTDFPEYASIIQKEIGIQDSEHASFVNKSLNNLSVAIASGNPQLVRQAIQSGAPALASMNVPADEAWQLYQSNPQQFGTLLSATRYATMPIEKQVEKQQEQQKIDETIRNNDMTNARGIRDQNIRVANSAADRELKKLLLQQKVISNRLGKAKTEAEIGNLNMKLQENQQKQQDVQQQKQMSLGYAAEAAALAREIASDDRLGDITGSISSRTPTFNDSSQDLINKASRLQSLLTQDNLKLMSGVLTERDIIFLGNIASGLNITEDGIRGSVDGVKKRLNAIASKLDAKLSASGYQQHVQQQTQQAQQPTGNSGFSSLWGD
ncbi:phage DNA ejection protein [Edwardsiella tarda]|uniref:phage DNA ejection protein n=1 Tax=Edwardsiella tarda TaxID=636 RepID=UPI000D50E812|nr:phage DNA ejection protein [Edwardsiella tarda]UCQ28434.1 phage DNA ejection protein [Edwardsiella tarda]